MKGTVGCELVSRASRGSLGFLVAFTGRALRGVLPWGWGRAAWSRVTDLPSLGSIQELGVAWWLRI